MQGSKLGWEASYSKLVCSMIFFFFLHEEARYLTTTVLGPDLFLIIQSNSVI
jgi:hypothetical protein